MHRHGRNIPGGMSAQQKRCSVQLKRRPDICKMRFGPGPPSFPSPPLPSSTVEWARWVPSRRPPLARTQLQPISRKREQNNSYRGAQTPRVRTRAKETTGGGTRRKREREGGAESRGREGERPRERERERDQDTDLYPPPPRPMSPFRFLPLPPLSHRSPVVCRSDPGGRPGPYPRASRAAGGIFKFCHVQV